ncbi:MAG: General stress protein 13 [Tenericutes bacterium ADurb.Bin239]|jgi:general stress protein 13|nr:MAG: General stress protein 13 [Tenericutes bacterium ADurb.Bin239]
MNVYELNEIVEGTITEIRPYGAIITFGEDRAGLLHIKQISDAYISNINTYLQLNAQIKVRIIEIDENNGFLKLSLKSIPYSERIIFERDKKPTQINPAQTDFSALEEALPLWIKNTIEEIEND